MLSSYIEKLNALNENSVWVFTKQETDFDEAFKSAKLFNEIPDRENVNIEEYFSVNHQRYDISTDRHRILVIPQLYGLITKTPFYTRGICYNKEKNTNVYDVLSQYSVGSCEYNTVKTEQILKLKIHAIIDTADNNSGYCVLPVIFIYKVLRGLKERYGINEISLDQLYTYVMTCKSYDEIDLAIEFIHGNCPTSSLCSKFKDRSRIITTLKKNINLFSFGQNSISINEKFDDYFYNNFMLRYDLEDFHTQLRREVDYSYFLYNIQNFDINLIDEPSQEQVFVRRPHEDIASYIEGDDESTYIARINSINENNINEDVADGASHIKPCETSAFNVRRRFKTNPLLGKIAIKRAYYSCKCNSAHVTFVSRKTGKNYVEAHHLVPVRFQAQIWSRYHINIDCVENLVALCPNCHKAIHLGTTEEQDRLIDILYRECLAAYNSLGFNISVDEIKELYHR